MKKFKGNRKTEEIVSRAKENGWNVDDGFLSTGCDHIFIDGVDAGGIESKVMFNVFNGHFQVFDVLADTLSNSPLASHMSWEFDGVDWYDKLLDTFYVPLSITVAQ